MQAVATLESLINPDRRTAPRRRLHLDLSLGAAGEKATIHDLSSTGILVETAAGLTEFDELEVELPEVGTTLATVIWSSGDYFGCQFHTDLPRSAVSAALLRSPFVLPEAPSAAPGTLREEDDEPDHSLDDRLPFAVRLRVILGSSLALWGLILWALGVF